MSQKNKTILPLIAALTMLVGIAYLIISYLGYQTYVRFFEVYGTSPAGKSVSLSSWDIIWLVHSPLIIGVSALLSGVLVLWKNIYSWSLFLAVNVMLLTKLVIFLYNFQFSEEVEVEMESTEFIEYIYMYWLTILFISILGIIGITRKSVLKSLPAGSEKWYIALVTFAVLLTVVVFI